MRSSIVVFLLTFAITIGKSYAEAPNELWGYYPGQSVEDALSIDPSRSLEKCDFVGVWKCIRFAKNLFGHYAKVYVQLNDAKKVKQVVINASTDDQTEKVKCSAMSVDIIFGYKEIYGPFEEEKGAFYKVHWRSPTRHLEFTAICISDFSGVLVGGLE